MIFIIRSICDKTIQTFPANYACCLSFKSYHFFHRPSLLIKKKSLGTRLESIRFSFVLISTFKNPGKLSVSSHRSFVLDLSISLSSSVELTELGHNFRRNFLPVTTVRRNLRAFSLKSLARGFPSVRNHLKDHGYHRERDILVRSLSSIRCLRTRAKRYIAKSKTIRKHQEKNN